MVVGVVGVAGVEWSGMVVGVVGVAGVEWPWWWGW